MQKSNFVSNLILSSALAVSAGFLGTPANQTFAEGAIVGQAQVGKAAPQFSLKDYEGKTVSLSDFKDKFVVLEWFNDKCPFDKKHYNSGNMQALQKEFIQKGVVWILINSAGQGKAGFHDNPAEYKQILTSWKIQAPYFLQDPDGKVGHTYDAKTTPDLYVIGKNGVLLYSGAIDDQPDADVESIKIAKNYVRQALDEALAGKPVSTSSTRPYG